MKKRAEPGTVKGKKSGKGLQDHSTLLAQVIDFLPDPTFAIDRDGKVILWNKAMEDFTHVPAASMIGRSDHECALPFYGTRRPMLVDLIFRPDEEIEKEYDFIQREHDTLVAEGPVVIGGLQRYIWGKAGPIYDTQGIVIGAIESVRDITERKKTDEALRHSEAKYRDIFLNVSDLLYLHDLNGNFIETNLASKKETGYTESDLEHLSVFDILPDRHRHRFKNYINNVVKNGSDEGFLTIRTKTGDERILEYRNSLITDPGGKPAGVRGSARDITARIRAQKQLRKERDLITSIIETSPAFFDAVDPQGRTIMMNQAMLRALGYSRDEVLGIDYRQMFIPEEERPAFSAAFEELVSSGRPVVHENRVLARDGGELLVQWHSRAVFRGDGTLDFIFGLGIDITEHRKAEKALRQSEERYRLLAENARDVIWVLDMNLNYVYVSPSVERMRGYTVDEVMQQTIDRIMTPESYHFVLEILNEELQGEREGLHHDPFWSRTFEAQLLRKDGSSVWTEITASFLRDDNGTARGILGITRDISGRKKAEEDLQQTQFAVEHLADEAFWITSDARFIYVNEAACRALGYTKEELLNMSVPDIDPLYQKDRWPGHWQELKEHGSLVFESIHRTRNGHEYPVELRANFLEFGGREFNWALARDITERKKADAALRESEERFRRLAEVSPQTFWMASPDWETLIYVSPAFERIFGMHVETVLQNPRAWLELVHPDDRESVLSIFGNNKMLDVEYEFRIVRTDGMVRWIRNSRSPVLDENGTVILLVGIAEDITDRKKTDEEHKIYEARLARSQKLEAIGTLAGGIAHDFNNILSAIIGYSELALEDLPEGSPVRDSLAEVLTAGDRARDLVKQILTFSRQVETERKPVRVQLIVKEALKLLRSSIPRTITITEHIDKTAGPVMADPTQIHQVIMNLCTNAYHAMLPTGGVMTVSVDSAYLDAHFASLHPELSEGNFLKLTVKDTGTGMDADTMKRIFDPFFTTKEKTKGTGLGLSTVHGIITDLGGTVMVTSQIGAGSTFEIYMPITERAEEDEEEPDTDLAKGKGETILLVDDEEAILHFAGTMLEQLGYRIIKTSSSLDALDIFRSAPEKLDLVITDQTMPGMTGAELAAEILKIRPSMPIILMTGFSEIIGPEEALARGIEEYLEKPFTRSAITRAVQRCLS